MTKIPVKQTANQNGRRGLLFSAYECSVDFEIQRHNNEWETEITGHIKWDGCANFETNNDCMMHVCGVEEFSDISLIMQHLYALAREYFADINSYCMIEEQKDLPELTSYDILLTP